MTDGQLGVQFTKANQNNTLNVVIHLNHSNENTRRRPGTHVIPRTIYEPFTYDIMLTLNLKMSILRIYITTVVTFQLMHSVYPLPVAGKHKYPIQMV